jgi:hypothetical protein
LGDSSSVFVALASAPMKSFAANWALASPKSARGTLLMSTARCHTFTA